MRPALGAATWASGILRLEREGLAEVNAVPLRLGRQSPMIIGMILFDFDGVIADSRRPVMRAVAAVAAARGVEPPTLEQLLAMDGAALAQHLNLRWYQIPWYVRQARRIVFAHAHEISLQAEALPMFAQLATSGVPLGILSSNEAPLIAAFTGQHLPACTFEPIVGSVGLLSKHRALARLLRRRRLPASALTYVGDEVRDVIAARRVGIAVIAVTWGKDCADLLAAAQPTHLVHTGPELLACLRRRHG